MAPANSIFRSKRLVISLIVLVILAIGVVGLHIWFVNNARTLLVEMVHQKSKGKVKLALSEVSFDFFSRKLKVREADLMSTDSTTSPTTYKIQFRKLTIRINSISALIFEKKLYLDSIKLHDPRIAVMQWRADTTNKKTGDELSLPQEMGKLYNSMLDVLDDVGIKRIIINNAEISLINKMKAGVPPVTISKIYFDLKRNADDIKNREAFVQGSQSIELRTSDQNILLPGGKHQLSFKKFHLELLGKHIQMDSCTIRALPSDSTKSSYTIFFDKLMLEGVDFGAMYQRNLIKADSVYCENPQINIKLNTVATGKVKKERPDPEEIIQELTGDLDLAFIGVKDAGIDIEIRGNKNLRISNSDKDDFELRGLRINSDSSRPVTVSRFDMRVSDFSLQNEDSTTSYTFDSVHFNNNRIILSNFAVATQLNIRKKHNYRDFRIPYFELTGIDWYEMVFQQNLKAREAQMINPVIRYISAGPKKKKRKSNIFSSLETIGELVTLEKVRVVNGDINLKMGPTTNIRLENAHLSLFSNELLQSTNNEGLRRAVDQLSFSKGTMQLKSTLLKLYNVRSTPTNLVLAGRVEISSKNNAISGVINNVVIDNMVLDDLDETIMVDGIRWASANVNVAGSNAPNKNDKAGDIQLRNVRGGNTKFNYKNEQTSVQAFLNSIQLRSLSRSGSAPMRLDGLEVRGSDLSFRSKGTRLTADNFTALNNGSSVLSGVVLNQVKERDTFHLKTPSILVNANLNEILAGELLLPSMDIRKPVITYRKWNPPSTDDQKVNKSKLAIQSINLAEPEIDIALHKNDSVSYISLPASAKSRISVNGFRMTNGEVNISGVTLNTTAATFQKPTGEIMGVEKGIVELQVSDLSFGKKDGKPSWSGLLNNLHVQNPNTFNFAKTNGNLLLSQLTLGNVNLSSAYLNDVSRLIKYNVSAWLRTGTGSFIDSNTTLKWFNAEYSYKNRLLSLDSFSYHPTQSRDSVIAKSSYQLDYITFHSGNLKVSDFNLEKYEKDSALQASSIHVTRPVITIYRDKKPPFLGGIIKPLPVEMIKRIGMPVSVERIYLDDGHLSYTEKHAKSRAEGTIELAHMNALISNFKNRDLSTNDSLSLSLNAYLQDSAEINLRVRESYTDTLAGFLMTLRMKPTTLSFLNPVLAPLSNIIFKSGTIDSLHLRAVGRDDISYGEMKMYYHDLRIRLVKEGQQDNRSLGANIVSYMANLVLIKKDNDGRTGLVYFERLRDRSFFNYIVKMTFSGMATSVGVKKNKKYQKQYERTLRERSLPPIVFD
jgi:hypothetical protein